MIAMKNNFRVFLFLIMTWSVVLPWTAVAKQKARVLSEDVDVYAKQDFDSEILETVHQNEVYWISNKTYGPFYRILLKSGKIGYIPDYELDIAGKGPFRPKAFGTADEDDGSNTKSKKDVKKTEADKEMEYNDEMVDDYENSESFRYHSVSVNLVNLHEDTMGGNQVADLLGVGYKYLTQEYAWGGMVTFKAPDYYAQKTGGQATGFSVWGDIGANYFFPMNSRFMARLTPGLTTHYSMIKVETTTRKYDLQDLTFGVFFEAGIMIRIQKIYTELSLRFNHEKNDYGSIGLALLF